MELLEIYRLLEKGVRLTVLRTDGWEAWFELRGCRDDGTSVYLEFVIGEEAMEDRELLRCIFRKRIREFNVMKEGCRKRPLDAGTERAERSVNGEDCNG